MKAARSIIGLVSLLSLAAFARAQEKPVPAGKPHVMGLPAYPETRDSRFTGSLHTNDVPLDAAVMTTRDDIDTVMAFFRETLKGSGVEWVENWLGPESGYIGFFDENSGTMRLVTTVAMPSGGTMMVYSSMDPRPLLKKKASVPADLPALPEASEVVTTETGEGGERQRTVGYRVAGRSRPELEKRLVQAAGKLGWKKVNREVDGAGNMLLFLKGRDRCIISVSAKQDAEEPAFQVTMVVNDRLP